MGPKKPGRANPLTKAEQESWLRGRVERRRPENASIRRWVGLGDRVLGISETRRKAAVTRETAKKEAERSRQLRAAVQETKRKARESQMRSSRRKPTRQ